MFSSNVGLGLGLGTGIFAIIGIIWLLAVLSLAIGIAAIISVATTSLEAFGPWWDNTRQTWLVGIAVSFLIPFGHLITGLLWFTSGRRPLRMGHGYVERPFWAGPPRPQPPYAPPPPPPR